MSIFGLSDKGRFRAENQDSFDLCETEFAQIAVVCDGMGGAAAGLLASDVASARFVAYVRFSFATGSTRGVEDTLRQAVDAANRTVYQMASENADYAGMGSTLVAGCFMKDKAVFVNVGDSRAYRVARDGMYQITKDHSLVQEMVDAGQLTPAQAMRHPRRNIITRAIGGHVFIKSDIFTVNRRPNDRFLLCSDGLTNAVPEAEIHRLILASDNAEDACKSLVQAALDNNARDNVTAIVFMTEKGDAQYGK